VHKCKSFSGVENLIAGLVNLIDNEVEVVHVLHEGAHQVDLPHHSGDPLLTLLEVLVGVLHLSQTAQVVHAAVDGSLELSEDHLIQSFTNSFDLLSLELRFLQHEDLEVLR